MSENKKYGPITTDKKIGLSFGSATSKSRQELPQQQPQGKSIGINKETIGRVSIEEGELPLSRNI